MILDDNPINTNDENIEDKEKCRICGKKINLTKEHIPPKCTGNNSSFEVFIPNFEKKNKLQFDKHRFDKGFYMESLCSECNNRRSGIKYVPEYENFVSQFKKDLLYDNIGNLVFRIKKVYPLRIIKQVFVMFLAIQNSYNIHFKPIQEFVKNSKSKTLDNKLRVFIYYNESFTGRMVPFVCRGSLKYHTQQMISEISFPPLGVVITDVNVGITTKMFEITCFKHFDYDKRDDFKITIPKLSVETAIPLGFGSPIKVDKEMTKNMFYYLGYNDFSFVIETGGGLSPL